MGKHRISLKAKCPYYKHEDTQVIYCDGVQDGTVTHLAFSNRRDAKLYKTNLCQGDYKKCHIYKMLDGKEKEDVNSVGIER